MSTATMNNNHHRRFVTPPHPEPLGPQQNKRRQERDGDVIKPSSPKIPRFSNSSSNITSFAVAPPKPSSPAAPRNQLLAGYLAHEFLTKGSLFGEAWDPARAEALPLSIGSRKVEAAGGESSKSEVAEEEEKKRRYGEVADLLKSDGAHVQGIVNPTQLARFLKL